MKTTNAKLISFVLLLIIIVTVCGHPALAGTLSIARDADGLLSSYRGEAPAPKIGNLLGTNLLISINDNAATVAEKDKQGQRHVILNGAIFSAQLKKGAIENRFNSYCFFDSGEKLAELLGADANAADLVLTNKERKLTGRIKSVDREQLVVVQNGAEEKIPVKDIQTIASSRVFALTALIFLPAGTNLEDKNGFKSKVARFELDTTLDEFMTASGHKRLQANITAQAYTKKQKTILIGASALATVAAISIPVALAVPLAGRRKITPLQVRQFEEMPLVPKR